MSRQINDFNRIASKLIASALMVAVVLLSSPGFLLADTIPAPTSDPTATPDTTAPAPALDIQPVQPPVVDPSASNTTTGDSSQNSATTNVTNITDITNQNYVQAFNDSTLTADTGSNTANYNTGSGIITTNKAEGDGQLVNVLNKNSTSVAPINDGTNINNELTIKNVNDANIINRVTANINSGNNSANFNTGHGMVTTGDANLGLNFFSLANTNLFGSQKFYANLQNVYNDYTGDINLSNELASGSSPLSNLLVKASNGSTGANSSNQSVVNVNDQTSITNQNTGKLNNEIDAKVTSGQNSANYNTGTGSIVSGGVNSSVNVLNFLNSNVTSGNWMLKTLNVFGDWKGNLTLPAMASPGLTATPITSTSNTSNSTVNNSTNLTNNNQAVISNNVTMQTDSGNNDASYNGGSGIVKIGAASAETNEMNIANTNVTGTSWWLIVVNRFGSWNGTAVGSPDAVAIKTTGISTVLTPLQSGVDVTNNEANINHTTDISNTNKADITNTLNVQAISGQNQAQRNSGHGYVETGDIKGVNNIINFANANITVGNWMVVVVNVFGNWDGNLVFSTPGGGSALDVGGSLSCPAFNNSGTGTITSANSATGAGSQNNSTTTTNTTNSATNTNNANLNNTTDSSATTGQNSANYNTGTGTVNTGQASAGSSVSNTANTNGVASGQSGGGGTSQSSTGTTGASSTNDSSATNNNGTTATNTNNATANNNVSGSTNTGQNSSNYNTSNGSVDTSWADTFLNIRNQVNDNKITLGQLNADFNQQPVAPGSQAQVPNDTSSTQTCPGVTVVVTPASVSLSPNGTQTFTAVANDPSGNAIAIQPTFTWTATGGTIDANGVFTAGNTTGSFAVTATASYGNQASADVTITGPTASTAGSGGGGGNIVAASTSGGGAGGGSGHRKKGDFNSDGKVNDLDFSILMSAWGSPRPPALVEDSGQGNAGDIDLSIVMSNWSSLI
jgi:hypothetical protein